MGTTFKAKYANGVLKPLETLDLKEGEEVSLTIDGRRKELSAEEARDILWGTAGAWADTVDCEKLERDIYESRLRGSRPKPEL